MTTLSRFTVALFAVVGLAAAALGAHDSRAAALYTVSLTPSATTAPIGSDASFAVRLETSGDTLPGLDFAVEGGEITGIVSPNVVAPGVALGAVHVTRELPGAARLTASLDGEVLATANLTFAQVGAVTVTVSTDVAADAAARTWRYEVLDPSGAVVTTLSVGTSGDAPRASATTPLLPYGYYTVRQLLGSDTKLACDGGAFYQLTAPVSGATTVQLAASNATASFAIHLCDGAPAATQVDIPIDTIQPPAGAGILGDALPGEPPINEVRGVRQEGPGEVLPPNTGSGNAPASSFPMPLLIAAAFLLLATPPLALAAAKASRPSNR